MNAPDVAALLARVDDVKYFVHKATKWNEGAEELARELDVYASVDALATALRAALADQRRLEWLDAQTMNVEYDGACPLPWSIFDVQIGRVKRSTLKGEGESLRAAIDAAMTADGGGV